MRQPVRFPPRTARARRCHVQPLAAEDINQAQNVSVIGNAKIRAQFILYDILRVDDDDDFRFVLKLLEHDDLIVRGKAWQYARSVEIVEQLAAKFQVQLIAEALNALQDFAGLHFKILLRVESDFFHMSEIPLIFITL